MRTRWSWILGGCVSGLVLLSGCQSSEQDATKTQDVADARFLQQVDQDTIPMLCSQPGYLQCFRITRGKCIADLKPFKANCMKIAKQKIGPVKDEKSAKAFGNEFTLCLLVNHAVKYPKRAEQIGQCLDTASFKNKPQLQ